MDEQKIKISLWHYTVYIQSVFPHGIENGFEYQYFSRYHIKVRNSSTVTALIHILHQ